MSSSTGNAEAVAVAGASGAWRFSGFLDVVGFGADGEENVSDSGLRCVLHIGDEDRGGSDIL